MAPNTHTCSSCNKIIKINSSCISCTNCKQWFHKKCSKITNEIFKKYAANFKKDEVNDRKCDKCQLEVSIIDSDSDQEEDDINESSATSRHIEQMFKKYLTPFTKKRRNWSLALQV